MDFYCQKSGFHDGLYIVRSELMSESQKVSDKNFHFLGNVRIRMGVFFVEIDANGGLLKSRIDVSWTVGHDVVLTGVEEM